MDFLYWAALSLHLFAVVIWLGGICFQSAILFPVLKVEESERSQLAEHLHRRFLPFVWLSLWTIGITGLTLMLLATPYIMGEGETGISIRLIGKILIFSAIVFASMRSRNAYMQFKYLIRNPGTSIGESRKNQDRIERSTRINVLLGIIALLLSALT